tara:strand:- start:2100 stop:2723 length:624 start_codon:yes stop_codon:yes gene_type:complete
VILKVSQRVDVKNLINEVALDAKKAGLVADRAYRHQLGFIKIMLGGLSDGQTLRLHYWDQDICNVQEDIHSHRESFISEVLSGCFEESIYALKNGDKFRKFIYSADQNGECCEATFDGLYNVELTSQEKLRSGDLYARSKESLHRVSKVEKGTVTLSIWDGNSSTATVLKDINGCVESCNLVSPVSAFEVFKIISKIKDEFFKYDFS